MFLCYSKTLCITKSLDSNSQTVKSLHFASCVSSCMNINVTVVKFVRALSFRCQLTQSHSIYYSKKCKVNGAVCQNIWCEMWYLQKRVWDVKSNSASCYTMCQAWFGSTQRSQLQVYLVSISFMSFISIVFWIWWLFFLSNLPGILISLSSVTNAIQIFPFSQVTTFWPS